MLSALSSVFLLPKPNPVEVDPEPKAGVEPEPNTDVGADVDAPKKEGLGQLGSDMGILAGTPNPLVVVLEPNVKGVGGGAVAAVVSFFSDSDCFLSSCSTGNSSFSGTEGRGLGDLDGSVLEGFGDDDAVPEAADLSVELESAGDAAGSDSSFFLAAACILSCISALRFLSNNI